MQNPRSTSHKLLGTLGQLGLTEYAARCYVALLDLGSAEASAVADAADVPRTKVYSVLKGLVDRGWAIADGGRPARYRAVAPAERIPASEKTFLEDTAAATAELQARHAAGPEMVPVSVFLVRGQPAITAKSVELVDRARSEVLLNLGFLLPGDAKPIHDAVARARRRGVAVRILLNAHPLPGMLEGVERFSDLMPEAREALFPWRAVISDFTQALMALPTPASQAGGERVVAMWNPSREFMHLLEPMLRTMWETAPPYLHEPA